MRGTRLYTAAQQRICIILVHFCNSLHRVSATFLATM